jgi:hypothetical protein
MGSSEQQLVAWFIGIIGEKMIKPIDESKYPLNTLKPLFRTPKMLYRIHRLQGVKLGDNILIPKCLAFFINNDITVTEVTDRCHLPHGSFLNAFPVDDREADYDYRRILIKWISRIYDLDLGMFENGVFRWDGRQFVRAPILS